MYRVSAVLTFFVGAIGLQILVNWAGELSLAHAQVIGICVFTVARLSSAHGISPLLLLPGGVVLGAASNTVIGLPALRVKGLQVALVTLVVALAIENFAFQSNFLVPGGSVTAGPDRIGSFNYASPRTGYTVILVFALLAVGSAWVLYHSKVARGLWWIKANRDGAAAIGIHVARYRLLAYTISGAFAGLAASMSVIAIGSFDSSAFPQTLSFSYLLIAVLAGPGFVGGVFMMTIGFEGVPLWISSSAAWFAYLGPVGLLLAVVQNRTGINGAGRETAQSLTRVVYRLANRSNGVTERELSGSGQADGATRGQTDGAASGPVGIGAGAE